jgi:hypothetical protein
MTARSRSFASGSRTFKFSRPPSPGRVQDTDASPRPNVGSSCACSKPRLAERRIGADDPVEHDQRRGTRRSRRLRKTNDRITCLTLALYASVISPCRSV